MDPVEGCGGFGSALMLETYFFPFGIRLNPAIMDPVKGYGGSGYASMLKPYFFPFQIRLNPAIMDPDVEGRGGSGSATPLKVRVHQNLFKLGSFWPTLLSWGIGSFSWTLGNTGYPKTYIIR